MVNMVGVACCTASFSNVCLGDAEILMEMDHLTLAEYRAHPESTFPAIFGGRVPHADSESSPSPSTPANSSAHGFISVGAQDPVTPDSSGYSNISRSSYEMLEK